MLCQKCQKKEATTYYQETVNGKTTTLHLCEDCAKELGIGAPTVNKHMKKAKERLFKVMRYSFQRLE